MEIRRAVRAGWWLVLLSVLVGGGAALLVSLTQRPTYTSSTQLFVSTRDTASTAEVFQGSQFSQQRVTSYAQLIRGYDLAQRVIARLGLPMSPADLQGEIEATPVPDTVLIDVSVSDANPQRAQRIAAAVGAEFTDFAGDLESTQGGGTSPVKVTVTDTAQVPTEKSAPKTLRNILIGLAAGVIVGLTAAIARLRLDRSVKEPSDLAAAVDAPLIGTILRDDALAKMHTVERTGVSRTAEDFRQLRTNLQFLKVDEPPRVIIISSAVPSEGKTTLTINLALALVEAGQTVTVVEADLRRPKVTRYLGMVSGVGLTNVLAGSAELADVRQTYRQGLSVIAAGPTPPNPGELLASSHMGSLLDKLRVDSDFVLIDAPPLLPVADTSGLAVHTDGVLLSVRYGSTRKDQLRQAGLTLERVGAGVLGVVLNIVPSKAELAQAYGYGYSYSYEAEDDGKRRKREGGKGHGD